MFLFDNLILTDENIHNASRQRSLHSLIWAGFSLIISIGLLGLYSAFKYSLNLLFYCAEFFLLLSSIFFIISWNLYETLSASFFDSVHKSLFSFFFMDNKEKTLLDAVLVAEKFNQIGLAFGEEEVKE